MEAYRLRVLRAPETGDRSFGAVRACARLLGIGLTDARALLFAAPLVLPRDLASSDAEELARILKAAGGEAEVVPQRSESRLTCPAHPTLSTEGACSRCRASVCLLCRRADRDLCPSCATEQAGGQRRRLVRLLVLLGLLLCVAVLYSWIATRRVLRNEWAGTLRIAVPILRGGPVPEPVVRAVIDRLPELESRLSAELERYRPGSPVPFELVPLGPLDVTAPPPPPPDGPGIVGRAAFAWEQHRYLAPIDEALGLEASRFDARIYLYVEPLAGPASLRFVEGTGALDGDYGIVRGALDDAMVDQALIAVGHELLHCLGASDKYDDAGHAMDPVGLAEPALVPRYPQRFAEIMVGELPLAPGEGRLASGLDELAVGPLTAAEIGWTAP